jgi:hypothetical protein
MLRTYPWSKSVPRVELDQRARDARLRLERSERLLVPRAAMTDSWPRRVLCFISVGIQGGEPPDGRTRGPLSDRRLSRVPTILEVWSLAEPLA